MARRALVAAEARGGGRRRQTGHGDRGGRDRQPRTSQPDQRQIPGDRVVRVLAHGRRAWSSAERTAR